MCVWVWFDELSSDVTVVSQYKSAVYCCVGVVVQYSEDLGSIMGWIFVSSL